MVGHRPRRTPIGIGSGSLHEKAVKWELVGNMILLVGTGDVGKTGVDRAGELQNVSGSLRASGKPVGVLFLNRTLISSIEHHMGFWPYTPSSVLPRETKPDKLLDRVEPGEKPVQKTHEEKPNPPVPDYLKGKLNCCK